MTIEISTVAEFQKLPEAEACKVLLESFGLTVFLADAEMAQVDWFLPRARVKVQVPHGQLDLAEMVLDQMRLANVRNGEPADGDVCLACESQMAEQQSHCSECGWSYLDEPQIGDDSAES